MSLRYAPTFNHPMTPLVVYIYIYIYMGFFLISNLILSIDLCIIQCMNLELCSDTYTLYTYHFLYIDDVCDNALMCE